MSLNEFYLIVTNLLWSIILLLIVFLLGLKERMDNI